MSQLSTAAYLAVSDDKVTPGVLGFLVVASLGVATWLLIRSMRRQLGKIDLPEPAEPEEPAGEPEQPDGREPQR